MLVIGERCCKTAAESEEIRLLENDQSLKIGLLVSKFFGRIEI